jgi:hypothetical protein
VKPERFTAAKIAKARKEIFGFSLPLGELGVLAISPLRLQARRRWPSVREKLVFGARKRR